MEADSAGSEKPFVCDFCPKRYLRKNNLEDHILMEHHETEQASDIIKYKARNGRSKGSLIMECEICRKRFRYQSDLKNHVESHFRGRGRGSRGANRTPSTTTRGSPRAGGQRIAGQPSARGGRPSQQFGGPAAAAADLALLPRTRPCLYCGKTFFRLPELIAHEKAEALDFERDSLYAENDNKMRMNQSVFETRHYVVRHVIDRTDEEFGADYRILESFKIDIREDGGGRAAGKQTSSYSYSSVVDSSKPLVNGMNDSLCNPMCNGTTTGPDHHQHLAVCKQQFSDQYNNQFSKQNTPTVNGDLRHATEDMPPPPPLPQPHSPQVCQKRLEVDLPDPHEAKTYFRLQSSDESHTHTSLLLSGEKAEATSLDKDVLDLSLSKEDASPPLTNGVTHEHEDVDAPADGAAEADPSQGEEHSVATSDEQTEDKSSLVEVERNVTVAVPSEEPEKPVLKPDVDDDQSGNQKPDPDTKSNDEDKSVASEVVSDDVASVDDDRLASAVVEVKEEMISFEPGSMPSMPEANIAYSETHHQQRMETNGDTEMRSLTDEYKGLINLEEDIELFGSPAETGDDPHRIDCKFCGMIFSAPHVRRFHERSHDEELEEYDGELTRLFCGFCGKTFKKAAYRILHEKGHTGELTVQCPLCERKFRWESELRSHSKNCTLERPAKSPAKKMKLSGGGGTSNRHAEKDDWISDHASVPTGWKVRMRPRPAQEGQMYFIYMSPEGQVFHSRKAVLQHMEKTGGYSIEDVSKVRQGSKTGPRNRRSCGGGGQKSADNSIDMDNSESNLDLTDLDSSDVGKKEADAGEAAEAEGCWLGEEENLPFGWKVRPITLPSGDTRYQFLAPDNTVLSSRRAVLDYINGKKAPPAEEKLPAIEDDPQPPLDDKSEIQLLDSPAEEDANPDLAPTSAVEETDKLADGKQINGKPSQFARWADLKMNEFRRKIPKRKRLVTNQVIVSNKVKALRREFVVGNEDIVSDGAFEREAVVFLPKLTRILKNPEIQEELSNLETATEVSVSVDSLRSDEGLDNNIDLIKQELKERQIDIDRKMCGEGEDNLERKEQRSLRFREKTNYEESALDDEVFQALFGKPKCPFRGRGEVPVVKVEETSEDEDGKGKERNRFSLRETSQLEKWFDKNPYPTKEERDAISESMKISVKKVRIWFQNKRCKTDDGKMKCFFARKQIPNSDSEDDLLTCSICKHTFSNKPDFKIHTLRVHGNENEKNICKDCFKAFDTMWNLKTHCLEEHSKPGGADLDEFSASTDEAGRTKFTRQQIIRMRHAFAANPYPDKEEYRQLADQLNISNKILHSWFQNHRHREKIQKVNHQVQAVEDDASMDSWRQGDEDDPKAPYNPGHKKTKFSDHQRYYLQSFFNEKEYVDEEEVTDLSAELRLSPKVIRIWFQHAREKKKKTMPASASTPGRGRGRGRGGRGGGSLLASAGRTGRGRSASVKSVQYEEDSLDCGGGEDSRSCDVVPKRSLVRQDSFSSAAKPNPSQPEELTQFQKVFLEDFYVDIPRPDAADLDYLCEHINVSREMIGRWFDAKNRPKVKSTTSMATTAAAESLKICAAIVAELIDKLPNEPSSRRPRYIMQQEGEEEEEAFTCPYCGKTFAEESLLREHKKLEAIEFEKEVLKFKEADLKSEDEAYVTLDDTMPESVNGDNDVDELSMDYFSGDDDDEDVDCYQDSIGDRSIMETEAAYVKRPLNPFMVWLQEERRKDVEESLDRNTRTTGELVRNLSLVWKSMSEFDKMPYIEEARRLKEIHRREHPNYTFNPNRRRNGKDYYHSGTAAANSVKNPRRANLVKSYLCKRCEVGFTTKGNLFKHLRNFHPENPYDPNFYELDKNSTKERKLRRCAKCNMDFISKIGLARHMLKAHHAGDETAATRPAAAFRRSGDDVVVPYFEEDTNDFDSMDSTRSSLSAGFYGSHRPVFGQSYVEPVNPSADRYLSYEDEEYGGYERRAHSKTRFTQYQRRVLLDSFHRSIAMTKCDAKKLYINLADKLDLPTKIVRIWFQNARSARKKGKPLFAD